MRETHIIHGDVRSAPPTRKVKLCASSFGEMEEAFALCQLNLPNPHRDPASSGRLRDVVQVDKKALAGNLKCLQMKKKREYRQCKSNQRHKKRVSCGVITAASSCRY